MNNGVKIREISRGDAQKAGIDLSMVKICEKLRKLAKLDRLIIDESEHRSGLNKHLLNYIKYIGFTPKAFIKEYMSNIQPYMLMRRKDQEKKESYVCVVDNIYYISLYIKADLSFGEEAVISFHEDNKRGIAKPNTAISRRNFAQFVPIFADSIGSVNAENGNVSLKVFIQRGMKILPLNMIGIKCDKCFIVRRADIDNQFLSYCNDYIRDLYLSDLNLDFSKIEVFSMLQQISFTSYGRDTFSSVSLLIDSLQVQSDAFSKAAADFALITFVQSLTLTDQQKQELLTLLNEKYKVTAIRGIDEILCRVGAALDHEPENDIFKVLLDDKTADIDPPEYE